MALKLLILTCVLILIRVLTDSVNGEQTLIRRAFNPRSWNYDEIYGYHFHTYFFQNNIQSINEALKLRDAVRHGINEGYFPDCKIDRVYVGLKGPHLLGNFETCCNMTSFSSALSFFMLNHGNLSVLLHPLTRYEVEDHTTRSMFLGPRVPIDTSVLSEDLGDELDLCFRE